jgi:hypothetical protein
VLTIDNPPERPPRHGMKMGASAVNFGSTALSCGEKLVVALFVIRLAPELGKTLNGQH